MKRILPFFVFGIIIALAVWQLDTIKSLFSSENQAGRAVGRGSVAVKVITQPVEMTNNDRVFAAVGTGRARLSVALYPAVSEEVKEVLFEAQQEVQSGDVLVQLDDREEQLAEQKDDWQEAIQDSPVDCGACRNRAFEKEWKVVADLENWLSLSASFYDFSGGAHATTGRAR